MTISLANSENSELSETAIFQNWEDLRKSASGKSFVENESPTKILPKPRVKNVNTLIIIGHININSLRNKSEMSKDCI